MRCGWTPRAAAPSAALSTFHIGRRPKELGPLVWMVTPPPGEAWSIHGSAGNEDAVSGRKDDKGSPTFPSLSFRNCLGVGLEHQNYALH